LLKLLALDDDARTAQAAAIDLAERLFGMTLRR
jgi:hypothetical protein